MPRYVREMKTKKSEKEITNLVHAFMEREGFRAVQYKGEDVWQKGRGLLTAPQFMKIDYNEGKFILQAWIKYALLPGVYVGEMGITGFTAFAIKKVLRSRVEELERIIEE